ncbi:hypothetical protein HID58_052181, partial [Brassica napus]
WKTSCYYPKKITGIVRIAISQSENGVKGAGGQYRTTSSPYNLEFTGETVFLRNQIFNKTITSLLLQIMKILISLVKCLNLEEYKQFKFMTKTRKYFNFGCVILSEELGLLMLRVAYGELTLNYLIPPLFFSPERLLDSNAFMEQIFKFRD